VLARAADFGAQIRRKRFEAYNREWCEAVWEEEQQDSPLDRRRSMQVRRHYGLTSSLLH
jgi:hypothetical protein